MAHGAGVGASSGNKKLNASAQQTKKNLDHAINLIFIRCKSMTSPCQLNSLVPKVGNIGLGPRVLMPPYHDAGPVAVQVQDPTPLKVVVLIEPVL